MLGRAQAAAAAAAAYPSTGSRRGLSGSRWLAFSMTEQPARDADWSQASKQASTKTQEAQMARPDHVQSVGTSSSAAQQLASNREGNSIAIFSTPRPRTTRVLCIASQPFLEDRSRSVQTLKQVPALDEFKRSWRGCCVAAIYQVMDVPRRVARGITRSREIVRRSE